MLSQRPRPVLDFLAPAALREGDLVTVVAPAGPFDREHFSGGLQWLGEHFRVRHAPDIFEREGFYAGSGARRLRELSQALACPETRALVCARGGYGSGEICQVAAFDELRRNPKWIVGFSDITLLHVEAQRQRVMSLHAHNLTGLGNAAAAERERWLSALLRPLEPRAHALDDQLGPARSGILLGGNLTLLQHAALTGRFRPPAGALLFVEETHEAPYRLARLLSGLEGSGCLDALGAIVVGQLTPAGEDKHGTSPREVFEQVALRNGLSLGWGLQAGHEPSNLPLPLGARARLSDGRLYVAG